MKQLQGDCPETVLCAAADWKDGPEMVLNYVDTALRAHGLEVLLYDDGSDSVVFSIAPRGLPGCGCSNAEDCEHPAPGAAYRDYGGQGEQG